MRTYCVHLYMEGSASPAVPGIPGGLGYEEIPCMKADTSSYVLSKVFTGLDLYLVRRQAEARKMQPHLLSQETQFL